MRQEVEAAVSFLVKVLSLKKTLQPDQLENLGKNLVGILCKKYKGHWYPDKPARGQAYRCIRINSWQYIDESLLEASKRCGIEYSNLPLPKEMTIWIDPFDVCGRFEEDSEYFTIATFDQATVTEPVLEDPEKETSDYSSEGTRSGTTSENSSDDEASGEKATTKEDEVATDEAIGISSSGTPVADLMDSENKEGQTGSDVEEAAQKMKNIEPCQ
ncbi:maternal B9.10 protein-like [Phyllobates terribilis]|uniref:maternal B9.10 protein-like n=1 Tax=Phyllobates terribilis TaxID=111132 RepID=UPI003CCA7438